MSDRLALIIANNEYDDPKLARLATPRHDAEALAEVLRDPAIGGFDVTLLANTTLRVVLQEIAHLYRRRKRDDLLLLYYSGHGIRDNYGDLYLAVKDTETDIVSATSINAAFMRDQLDRSRSLRKVVILDSCHSGLFARGGKALLGSQAGAGEAFAGSGYGRVILTASNAVEFAWEGDRLVGEAETSVFTHFLVEGLQTGAADLDGDGQISLDELYDYVYEQVVTSGFSKQTPQKWAQKIQGRIIIAQNPHPVVTLAELPAELQQALQSAVAWMREGAVSELERLLQGSDKGLAHAAHEALTRLADDDSRRVSAAAAQALGASPLAVPTEPSPTPSRSFVVEKAEPELELHPSLALELSVKPQAVDAGGESRWTVTLRNDGDDDLRYVTMTRGQTLLDEPFDLAVGEGRLFTFTTTYETKGNKTEQVAVTGIASNGESVRYEASANVQVHPPLVEVEIRQFFAAAGFELKPLDDPLAFLCHPASPTWERQFSAPIYARLFYGELLNREAVAALHRAAQAVPEDVAGLFAIVDSTPTDSGLIEIGALRADDVQVIPIDDAIIQRGREERREHQTLKAHLRRYLGRRRDLYNVRDPVADRLSFFGREVLAGELLSALEEGQPLALFGLRKIGKSSLLQFLRDRASFPVAYVDLQAGAELTGLYARILKSWQRSLRVKVEGIEWRPPASSSEPSAAFTAAVHDLMAQLEEIRHSARLGLFVDEVEVIVPRELEGTGSPDPNALACYLAFARTLRGLAQETDQFVLLVVGVDPWLNRINRWAGQQNPFYQFFREEYLGPLSGENCIQMVRSIGRQMGLDYSEEAVTFVAEVSGGHPFLARQLCSAAFQALGENVAREITLAQLQAAASRFVRKPDTAALLDEGGLWGEVTDSELWPPPQILENQALLISLAETEPQPEPALLAAGQNRTARERSLLELEHRAVLGRLEEMLRIQFGLFRNWIRRYKLEER